MDVHHKDYYSECQLVSDDTRNEARAVTENTNSSNAGDVDEVDNAFEATLPASDGSNFVSVATGLPSSGDKGHGMSLDVPATVSTDVWKSGRPRIRTLSYHSTKGLMSDYFSRSGGAKLKASTIHAEFRRPEVSVTYA
ncbi:unnamed protein product [Toxocara canis]|uniref:Uncharacterized protein n=1 Tax=Toxocara canis TaxID=6265 RepID=A0A183U064_TOXCA|nr:unnamed protein product [Toxocara canis]